MLLLIYCGGLLIMPKIPHNVTYLHKVTLAEGTPFDKEDATRHWMKFDSAFEAKVYKELSHELPSSQYSIDRQFKTSLQASNPIIKAKRGNFWRVDFALTKAWEGNINMEAQNLLSAFYVEAKGFVPDSFLMMLPLLPEYVATRLCIVCSDDANVKKIRNKLTSFAPSWFVCHWTDFPNALEAMVKSL